MLVSSEVMEEVSKLLSRPQSIQHTKVKKTIDLKIQHPADKARTEQNQDPLLDGKTVQFPIRFAAGVMSKKD